MINKIKQILLSNGFKQEGINGKEVFVKGDLYVKIDFVKDWNEYIIETANLEKDAKNNLFEDSDYIKVTATDREIEDIIANL